MATPDEFQLACPRCDGPGLYAIQDGHRVRTGMTSNLSRFVRRQRAARVLYVARLEPGETTRAWRSLLNSLRGLIPKECQYEAGAVRDVARGMYALQGPGISADNPRTLEVRLKTRGSRRQFTARAWFMPTPLVPSEEGTMRSASRGGPRGHRDLCIGSRHVAAWLGSRHVARAPRKRPE